MTDCSCAQFLVGYVPSTNSAVRPATWRSLDTWPGLHWPKDVSCTRGDDLILAFCVSCQQRWYFSWDVRDCVYNVIQLNDQMVALITRNVAWREFLDLLTSQHFAWYGYALSEFLFAYVERASVDLSLALEQLKSIENAVAPQVAGAVRAVMLVVQSRRRDLDRKPRRTPKARTRKQR